MYDKWDRLARDIDAEEQAEEQAKKPAPEGAEAAAAAAAAAAARAAAEAAALESGAVLTAPLEPPADVGAPTPADGDLVLLRLSLASASAGDAALQGLDAGGGATAPFVLGAGAPAARRLPRGLELAVGEMRPGERRAVRVRADYGYAHPDRAGAPAPPGVDPGAALDADVRLLACYPASEVRPVAVKGAGAEEGEEEDSGGDVVFVRRLAEGEGWETPRPPFEVALRLEARALPASGAPRDGAPFFATPGGADGGAGAAPLVCRLGAGRLPRGLEAALGTMLAGEAAAVLCPARLARGAALVPDPPAGAAGSADADGGWVEYTVALERLLQVRDLTGDGGAVKATRVRGRGDFPVDCPLEPGTEVAVRVRARRAGGGAAAEWVPITSLGVSIEGAEGGGGGGSPASGAPPPPAAATAGAPPPLLRFTTGAGEAPPAVDLAAPLMLRGEVAAVEAAWAHAYAGRADAPPGLAAGEPVEFEVELVDFEALPPWAAMAGADRLARVRRWKDQGNALFRLGAAAPRFYELARARYERALKAAARAHEWQAEDDAAAAAAAGGDARAQAAREPLAPAAAALAAALLANLALVALRVGDPGEAARLCDRALAGDPGHAKALFRRGAARAALADFDGARADLRAAAAADPRAAREAARELRRVDAAERAADARQRREMGAFLGARPPGAAAAAGAAGARRRPAAAAEPPAAAAAAVQQQQRRRQQAAVAPEADGDALGLRRSGPPLLAGLLLAAALLLYLARFAR